MWFSSFTYCNNDYPNSDPASLLFSKIRLFYIMFKGTVLAISILVLGSRQMWADGFFIFYRIVILRLRFNICLRALLTYPANSENLYYSIFHVNLFCNLSRSPWLCTYSLEWQIEEICQSVHVIGGFQKNNSCSCAAFSRVSRHSVAASGPLKRDTEQIFRNYVTFSEAINFH
jgi:hypothetical protein